jgi:hypothetical protein
LCAKESALQQSSNAAKDKHFFLFWQIVPLTVVLLDKLHMKNVNHTCFVHGGLYLMHHIKTFWTVFGLFNGGLCFLLNYIFTFLRVVGWMGCWKKSKNSQLSIEFLFGNI